MAAISDSALLQAVKDGLGISGSYQDNTISVYIAEVKEFLSSMGIPAEVVSSEAAVGCILRGVSDLWNFGSGDVKLSQYFVQRAIQLAQHEADAGGGG